MFVNEHDIQIPTDMCVGGGVCSDCKKLQVCTVFDKKSTLSCSEPQTDLSSLQALS